MGFIDSVFGTSKGNKEIERANADANLLLDSGLTKYINQTNSGLEDVGQYYDPYIQFDNDVTGVYSDAIGLNGQDPQQAYFNGFQNDPGFQASLDEALNATERSAAARGGLFSGRTTQGLFNQAQTAQYGAYQDRLNRLAALRGSGQQAASQLGGLTYNANQNIADAKFGVDQQKAAGVRTVGNAKAQSRGSGFQGIMNLASNAAKAFI